MTNVRLDIAAHIRRVDGSNRATPHALGEMVSSYLTEWGYEVPRTDVIDFVRGANPDKAVGAAALADKIVDHFGLDEGN